MDRAAASDEGVAQAVGAQDWVAVPAPGLRGPGRPEAEFASSLQHKLEVKTPEQLAKMRAACLLGRAVMDVAAAIKPGVTTDQLDRICHAMTLMNGAYPSPRNYMGFPKSLCTSVNEVVCHGIPDARPLEDGDIVNLDITVCLNGYHGDLNETYMVGTGSSDPERAARAKALMKCALECLELAMARCVPGARFRDSRGDTDARQRRGYGVVKDFRARHRALFHCAPNVPHYAKNKAVVVMKPDDVYDRADGERGDAQDEALAGRVDGGDGGWRAERAVRAHHGGDGNRPGRSHETHRKLAPVLLSIVIDVVLG